MSDHRVSVNGEKYTFVLPENEWQVSVLRYGAEWIHYLEGSNAVHAMMCELDAARLVVAVVRGVLADGDDTPIKELRNALEKHDALVSDSQAPSPWTTISR